MLEQKESLLVSSIVKEFSHKVKDEKLKKVCTSSLFWEEGELPL